MPWNPINKQRKYTNLFLTYETYNINRQKDILYSMLSPRGMVGTVLNCDIVVSDFELQQCSCVYFWINNDGEKYESPYLLAMVKI